MGLFDQRPATREPEPSKPPRPAWLKPADKLAGVVAEQLVLAHTDRAAVVVTGLLAYPTGFEFTLSSILRAADLSGRLFDPRGPVGNLDGPLPPELLRLGLRFPDGRTVTNLDRQDFPPDAPTDGPLLIPESGQSDHRRRDQIFWVWPLPPPGPVTFSCAWPAVGIPETSVDLDARLIHDAAARAVHLWPEGSGSTA